MANTPAGAPPRYSKPLASPQVDLSEGELFELLRKALEPTFVLIRRLGAGGMGIVYLARDPALKRLVAVKVMSPERARDPEARARFEREAEAVAKISHPNVVAVHSVGELANGIPYLVMQYVEGRSMAERLVEEGPLGLEETKSIMGQVAAALAAAHAKGVVHRDIKAANILWDDASGRALVSDFGIAAILQSEPDGDAMHLTQTGTIVGTPKYMSPEQLLAERVTEKTDVYSLGLLAYEMLAREGPFPVSSPNQLIVAHMRDVPRSISTLRADVDPAFDALISACLEKDPHARPEADDIARRLVHSVSVVLEWPPPGLEEMQGAAADPAKLFFIGGLVVAVPLVSLVSARPDSPLYLDWPAAMILPAGIFLGVTAMAVSAAALGQLLPRMRRAAQAGYDWRVLYAVVADDRKDMGAVIAGEREYAALNPSQRDAIRRWRGAGLGLRLAAGAWGVAGLIVALPVAALTERESAFAFTMLGVPLIGQLAITWLKWREWKIMKPIRARLRRHAAQPERLSSLAGAWRAAFERVAREQFVGAVQRRAKRIAVTAAAVAALVFGGGIVAGLTVTATMGKFARGVGVPEFNGVEERYRTIARVLKQRAAIDPSITPRAAGEALYAISAAGRPNDHPPFERGPTEVLPKIVPPAYHSPLFGNSEWLSGPAMRAAAHGLTPDQRRFLEAYAALPGKRQIEIVGHSSRADFFDAIMVRPLPPGVTIFDLSIPRMQTLRAATAAHTARAILARADGRPADAERMLREVIGFGAVMTAEPTTIENLVGLTVVGRARGDLVALLETTGRAAEARVISTETDPQPRELARAGNRRETSSEQDVRIRQTIIDSTRLAGIRWEFASRFLAFKPCVELRDIVFGPGPEHAEQMAEARRVLVHTPGEDALMRMSERLIEDGAPGRPPRSVGERSLAAFARTVDALTRSHRMSACVSFMNGLRVD